MKEVERAWDRFGTLHIVYEAEVSISRIETVEKYDCTKDQKTYTYLEMYRAGSPFPALPATREQKKNGTWYRIFDGHHRLAAVKLLGLKKVTVRFTIDMKGE